MNDLLANWARLSLHERKAMLRTLWVACRLAGFEGGWLDRTLRKATSEDGGIDEVSAVDRALSAMPSLSYRRLLVELAAIQRSMQ